MNVLDVVLVGAAISAVVGGYRLGFLARMLSWIGLGAGLLVAVKILPSILDHVDGTDHLRVVVVTLVIVLAGAALGQMLGLWVGSRFTPGTGARGRADRLAGAVAGLVGLIGLVWLLAPVLGATPGLASRLTQGSSLVRALSDRLPDPPDAVQALRSLVGDDRFPQVFETLRTPVQVPAPPPGSGLDAATTEQVARSVVKVEGVACDRIQDGSGFVVSDDLVVTNAHVVAGERRTEVEREDGRHLEADVLAFDPVRDLALLKVQHLNRPGLPISAARLHDVGGVFGHPGGEPLRVAPFSVAAEISAVGRDIYGQDASRRQVLELAASLRPGDSGSALVDARGEVVGVAFAIATDHPGVAYALAVSELTTVLAGPQNSNTSTGACIG